jgi:integrase
MSTTGPRLIRTQRDGYGVAKFNGRSVHFGFYDDPETHKRFDAAKARWLANGRQWSDDMRPRLARGRASGPVVVTVGALCDAFLEHLRQKHDAAWQRNNYDRIRGALDTLRALFGLDPASGFDPASLELVRQHMVQAGKLCRGEINRRVIEIRRCFSWAVVKKLVPPATAQALRELKGLRAGEFGVREGRQVRPVDRATIDATLPHLSSQLAAVVELLWHTGARPSEILTLRPQDIDRTVGKSWVANLRSHKLAKLGMPRAIFFGPKAQRFLAPFLLRAPDAFCFSPAEAVAEHERKRADARTTPLYPSEPERRDRERLGRERREVGDVYDAHTLRRAIARAVTAANRQRKAAGLPPIAKWHPYQVRHAAATRLRADFGLDVARCVLGHSSATMTEVYAEIDQTKARAAIEQIG